jgi:hypothetical protein
MPSTRLPVASLALEDDGTLKAKVCSFIGGLDRQPLKVNADSRSNMPDIHRNEVRENISTP